MGPAWAPLKFVDLYHLKPEVNFSKDQTYGQINIMDGESMTLRWESMCDGRVGEVDPNPILQELLSR